MIVVFFILFHLGDERIILLPENEKNVNAEDDDLINLDPSYTLHDAAERGKHYNFN